ncbi:MAG: hypothetical protein HY880_02365 [Deltaproteobacteria bacterium]|nr:hypothetical protein [Deltaproteobacteria bacterium]
MAIKVIKSALLMLIIILPVIWLSDRGYSFYPKDGAYLTLGFKHSGKKAAGCDETAIIKRAAESYKESAESRHGIKMDLSKLAECQRERFPVTVELYLDGALLVSKDYAPTGIKRDMASYIFEQINIPHGRHTVLVKMNDSGPDVVPSYILEQKFNAMPGSIWLVRYDEFTKALVLE